MLNSRIVIIGLILVIGLLSVCAMAGWARAENSPSAGLCYVSDWQADGITVRWYGAPWYPEKIFAVFTLLRDGQYWATTSTDNGAWYGIYGDAVTWMDYDYRCHKWTLESLKCFALVDGEYIEQDASGTWYQNFQRYFVGSLVIK